MFCKKYNKNVLVENCEKCLSERICDPVCVKREFVWAVPDNAEPRWVYTYSKAERLKTDVSYFFDPKWEGNTHLREVRVCYSYKKIPIPPEIRWIIWERDNFTCKICNSRKHLSIDHIIPESRNGDLSESNLQTLCKSCNSKKSNKVILNAKN